MPRPIMWSSAESDLGWTSRIHFDNVTLTFHIVTLTLHTHVITITRVIAEKQTIINEVHVFSRKHFIERYIKSIILLIKLFGYFNRAEPTCYRTKFSYFSSSKQNGACLYIVLCVVRLTYTRGLIRFSNCAGLSRLLNDHADVSNGFWSEPSSSSIIVHARSKPACENVARCCDKNLILMHLLL